MQSLWYRLVLDPRFPIGESVRANWIADCVSYNLFEKRVARDELESPTLAFLADRVPDHSCKRRVGDNPLAVSALAI
jgi:hypothetical protein